MNWFLIFVVVVLAGFTLNGYRKGFIKVAFSLISIIVTILLVSVITPYVSDFLENHTPVYNIINEKCIESIKNSFNENNISEASTDEKEEWIDGLWIPVQAKKMLKESNGVSQTAILDISEFTQYVGDYIAKMVIKSISFIAAFLIITFILRITVFTLDSVAKLPVLNGINRIAGLGVGLIEGLLIVWIIFVLIIVFFKTDLGVYLLGEINKNYFLKLLYDNNILLKLAKVWIN